MKENFINIKFVFRDGNLVPANKGNEMLLENFKKGLADKQPVYVLLEAGNPNASKSQKNIFNLNCRKIAEAEGCSITEIKKIIKDRCGLGHKSSEDVSVEEMCSLIEEVKIVCDTIEIPFIGL